MTNSNFDFEYYAEGVTAGKDFNERLSYNSQSNLFSLSSSVALVDPDNSGKKPQNSNFKKTLTTHEVDEVKQVIFQNNFFNVEAGENPFESPDKSSPLDPHYYSLKVTMDNQTHIVYWGNQPNGHIRQEPNEVSNIEHVIRGLVNT